MNLQIPSHLFIYIQVHLSNMCRLQILITYLNTTNANLVHQVPAFQKDQKKINQKGLYKFQCLFYSPVSDIIWISPNQTIISNTVGKYEISDFSRVLTIWEAKSTDEGVYTCKGSRGNERVFLNVTCKIFILCHCSIVLDFA